MSCIIDDFHLVFKGLELSTIYRLRVSNRMLIEYEDAMAERLVFSSFDSQYHQEEDSLPMNILYRGIPVVVDNSVTNPTVDFLVEGS